MSTSPQSTRPIHPISPRRIDIASIICEITSTYTDAFEARGIDVDLDVPQNLWVEVDPVLIRDVFRKLIDNSIEAMPGGGQLVITSLIGRDGLEIEVADSGRTVSAELKERIFEPYATTKHGHIGLGLAMVREIVESHQGTIEVDDCPEGGTAFTLVLPLPSSAGRRAA